MLGEGEHEIGFFFKREKRTKGIDTSVGGAYAGSCIEIFNPETMDTDSGKLPERGADEIVPKP